jgi:hypothetical protein
MMSILEGCEPLGRAEDVGWATPLGRMASTNYLALVHVRDNHSRCGNWRFDLGF